MNIIAKPSDHARYSGILVHPTSFPSDYGIGDFGKGAYEFIDYLKLSGQTLWQILPLGPTGFGDSPYQSFSAFAGQPLLISPELLIEDGLLAEEDITLPAGLSDKKVNYGAVIPFKFSLYKKAYRTFCKGANPALSDAFAVFCDSEKDWLDDYAFFMACKDAHNGQCWLEWEPELLAPTAAVREKWTQKLSDDIGYYQFIQFLFFRQWANLKDYANQNGIRIIGDIPIFVSLDSVDVWSHKQLFDLNEKGYPNAVSGVPPDYFSATGQLWGNPLYNWKELERTGFDWWIRRVKGQLRLVDILRIDHFRGFVGYWAVPYGSATAIHGQWLKAPGREFLLALKRALGENLPIWAEDLGVITKEVEALRDDFHLPGMRVLQFAFEDPNDNMMMPHNHMENCICYPGTHDNDTAKGWYSHSSKDAQKKARQYMNTGAADVAWAFIRTALSSVATYTVIPLQDVMSLGSEARMYMPGRSEGNWAWRYQSSDLDADWGNYLRYLTKLYHR